MFTMATKVNDDDSSAKHSRYFSMWIEHILMYAGHCINYFIYIISCTSQQPCEDEHTIPIFFHEETKTQRLIYQRLISIICIVGIELGFLWLLCCFTSRL